MRFVVGVVVQQAACYLRPAEKKNTELNQNENDIPVFNQKEKKKNSGRPEKKNQKNLAKKQKGAENGYRAEKAACVMDEKNA